MAARLAEAKAAGFDTVEAYEADIAAKKNEARQKRRQERADKKSADDDTEDEDAEDAEDTEDAGDAEEAHEASPAHLRAIAKFGEAVEMLRSVMTKPLAIFDDTKTPTDVTDEVSRFLEEVGQRKKLKLHMADVPIDASELN
jgi:hypothetical protein